MEFEELMRRKEEERLRLEEEERMKKDVGEKGGRKKGRKKGKKKKKSEEEEEGEKKKEEGEGEYKLKIMKSILSLTGYFILSFLVGDSFVDGLAEEMKRDREMEELIEVVINCSSSI